jgi:hypothetical protein
MAVLGMETSSGDFEVIDLCFAGLPDIYTPQASTSTNGKGKAKAADDGMELDGTSHVHCVITPDYFSRAKQNVGRYGIGTIDGCSGGTSGPESRDDGRMAHWRGRRIGGT